MWTDSIDKIFLINLAKRTDRLLQSIEQLNKFNIKYERVEAIEMKDGAEGLRLTMLGIFEKAIENNWQNILVFEDDMDILEPDFNEIMDQIVQQFPPGFDMILLGGQLCKLPEGFYWTHLLKVKGAYATHAVIYSLSCIKEIMRLGMESPIDNWLVSHLQVRNLTFMAFPMLISQIVSKSDIYSDCESMDWKEHLEIKYYKRIEQMKEQGKFIRKPQN